MLRCGGALALVCIGVALHGHSQVAYEIWKNSFFSFFLFFLLLVCMVCLKWNEHYLSDLTDALKKYCKLIQRVALHKSSLANLPAVDVSLKSL